LQKLSENNVLNENGRLLIPAAVGKVLGLNLDDEMILCIHGATTGGARLTKNNLLESKEHVRTLAPEDQISVVM
jgi:bifunctional DNA-binding transcriptional regulator/antitoxin component of YhaV-PrlF toxin-antitoxin module